MLPPILTHSYLLPPTPTYFHLLAPTPTYSHPIPHIPIHSHSLSPTSTHFLPTRTHFQPFHPFSLMFIPLLLVYYPSPPMCNLSHPFPVDIQILSPNPTRHLPFQPIFSPCVLHADTNFNVNLFFLLFWVLFRKQLITLGLTTTFVYFQDIFCSLKILPQWGEYINL